MKRAVLALGAVLLVSGCGSLSSYMPTVEPVPGTNQVREVVSKVVDGDTIKVQNDSVTVRILGIDSPETKRPGVKVQCGGPESSKWAAEQLPVGSTVMLSTESGREDVDRYGRKLAYVGYMKDGIQVDFSVESARAGMSHNYVYDNKPVSKQNDIAAAEAEAKNARRGFWGHC